MSDVQVHYGRASLSPLSKLPAYFVFTRQPLDCQSTSRRITDWACQAHATQKAMLLIPDQPLAWALQGLKECLQTDLNQVSQPAPKSIPIAVALQASLSCPIAAL